ncbi:MAG: hypothetical protein ACJAUP_000009 [Cellvibrionaceae bacterium]|jgi:hypothetical protein
MNSIKKQKGLSGIGWLFVISVLGFSLLLVSKLGPHYLDNRFVVSTLQTLADDPEFPRMAPSEIRSKLYKIFTLNNIRGTAVGALEVVKNSKSTLVTINYEERISLMHNIDVVLTFNSLLDSARPGECCSGY